MPVFSLSPTKLATLFIFIATFIEAIAINEVPAYMRKLQQLRQAAVQDYPQHNLEPATTNKWKPKRYKCVLIEDDDDDQFVSESEHSFIKIIPHSEDAQKIKKFSAPSFASEILKHEEADDNEAHTIYYTAMPPSSEPLSPAPHTLEIDLGSVATDRRNHRSSMEQAYNVYEDSQESNETVTLIQKPRKSPLKQIHLPVVQEIPLKEPLQKISIRNQNAVVPETAKHIRTPDLPTEPQRPTYNNNNSTEQRLQAPAAPPMLNLNQFPRRTIQKKQELASTLSPKLSQSMPNDLILTPEHCQTIARYANVYNVKDVKGWVHHNCGFAKMYLPNATCEEIDMLVASCYR